jgi:DNA (cytosine-5)-methyltransferase 3A
MTMNVLSLFDGCSGGQVALQKLGIHVDNYYASEIDKYAIKVTQANFPNTIQLGDVTQVKPSERGMGVDYALDYDPPIDLLMGGSPCQGFSFAGHQLNFDDPRSKLFFDFIRIRDECMPKYVLLENVRMAKKSQDVISKYMGFEPQALNSSRVSAQNRYRLYWFGKRVGDSYEQIPIPPMIDKGITMQDILEDGYATDEMTSNGKSHCLTARYNGAVWWNSIERKQRTMVLKDNPTMSKDGLIRVGTADLKGHDSIKRVYAQEGKAPTLTTMQGGHREPKVAVGRIVNRRLDEHGTRKDYQLELPYTRQIEVRKDEKSNCLTTVQKDNVLVSKDMWRKLTPLECERLQTLPDNYTNHVSNSQRYKMIGNGWTVDVIAHILKGIPLSETWHEMYNNNKELV